MLLKFFRKKVHEIQILDISARKKCIDLDLIKKLGRKYLSL